MTDIPRLTGGIFFTLLLEARRQRISARATYNGESDGLSDTSVLRSLIRVMDPDYREPAKSTFKQNSSDYKSCQMDQGTYLPFNEMTTVTTFDDEVKNSFIHPYERMASLVDDFIDPDKLIWFISALIETIQEDSSINADQVFYLNYDIAITKEELSELAEIDPTGFMVGMWHFIVLHRPENKSGRNTYLAWTEKTGAKNSKSRFISDIGRNLDIKFSFVSSEPELNEDIVEDSDEVIEPEIIEPSEETNANSEDNVVNKTDEPKVVSQTANVFNQYGDGNIQIGNIDTLIIK